MSHSTMKIARLWRQCRRLSIGPQNYWSSSGVANKSAKESRNFVLGAFLPLRYHQLLLLRGNTILSCSFISWMRSGSNPFLASLIIVWEAGIRLVTGAMGGFSGCNSIYITVLKCQNSYQCILQEEVTNTLSHQYQLHSN